MHTRGKAEINVGVYLEEKGYKDCDKLLNNRTELIAVCRHQYKYLLCHLPLNEFVEVPTSLRMVHNFSLFLSFWGDFSRENHYKKELVSSSVIF